MIETASEKQTVDLPLHNGCGMAPVRWSCHSAMLKLHVSAFSRHTNEKVCNPIIHKRVSLLHSRNWNGCFSLAFSLERCEICSPGFSGTQSSQCFTNQTVCRSHWFNESRVIAVGPWRIESKIETSISIWIRENREHSRHFYPFKVAEPQRTAVFVGRSVEKGTMLGVLLWAGLRATEKAGYPYHPWDERCIYLHLQ